MLEPEAARTGSPSAPSPPTTRVLQLQSEVLMHSTKRELLELERRKVSEAGRVLREWQEKLPHLQRQADLEEAGQADLNLGEDPE